MSTRRTVVPGALVVGAVVVALIGTACTDRSPSGSPSASPPTGATTPAEDGDGNGVTVDAAPTDGLATVCAQAAATVGRLRAPTDLAGLATAAAAVAVQADAGAAALATTDPKLDAELDPGLDIAVDAAVDAGNVADALAFVTDAAGRLATAADPAPSDDPAELADAVATLVGAFDELEIAATELGRDDCGADAWGRGVAAAAVDLTVAAG